MCFVVNAYLPPGGIDHGPKSIASRITRLNWPETNKPRDTSQTTQGNDVHKSVFRLQWPLTWPNYCASTELKIHGTEPQDLISHTTPDPRCLAAYLWQHSRAWTCDMGRRRHGKTGRVSCHECAE